LDYFRQGGEGSGSMSCFAAYQCYTNHVLLLSTPLNRGYRDYVHGIGQ
jgi:hypothetical protein